MNDEDSPDPAAALTWASDAHENQRYGHLPYSVHLGAVGEVLRQFGHGDDPVLMSAGYLHDTIEDQGVHAREIAERFGERVADIVDAVSDPPGATAMRRRPRPTRGSARSTTPWSSSSPTGSRTSQAGGPKRERTATSRRRFARACARRASPTTCGRTSTPCSSADQPAGRFCGSTYSR